MSLLFQMWVVIVIKETKKESFYDKYFFLFWYASGFIVGISQTLNPEFIEKTGLPLAFVGSFAIAVPISFVLYIIYVFSYFIISLFIDGVKEKDIVAIFAGIYLLLGLVMFISGLST